VGLHLNGDNTAATACGLKTTTVGTSATFSACLFIRLDSAVADLTDIWICSSLAAVSLNTEIDGLTPRIISNALALDGGKMSLGVWWFLGFSANQSTPCIYSAPVGASSLFRAIGADVNTAVPTSYALGNGFVPGTDSAPIGTIAHAKYWDGIALSPADFALERLQQYPARKGAKFYWPLSNTADVVDRISGNVLSKIASGTPGNANGASPPVPQVYRPKQFSFVATSSAAPVLATAGEWDPVLLPVNLFDVTETPLAWFDKSLIAFPAGIARSFGLSVTASGFVSDAFAVNRLVAAAIAGDGSVTANAIVLRALLDHITGPASVVDTLAVARPFADAIAGAGHVAPAIQVQRTLVDHIAGAASVTDTIRVSRNFVDALAPRATVTDALAVQRALADAVTGLAAVSLPLTILRTFFDAGWAGHGTMANALAVKRAVAAPVAGTAAVTPALAVKRALADTITGHSAVSDTFAVTRMFADAVAAHASLTDALTVSRHFADSVVARGTVADNLIVRRNAAVAVAGHGALADAFAVRRAVALAASGHAAASFALLSQGGFVAAIAGHASTADTLAVTRGTTLPVAAHSAVQANVGAARAMAASAAGHGLVHEVFGVQLHFGLSVVSSSDVLAAILVAILAAPRTPTPLTLITAGPQALTLVTANALTQAPAAAPITLVTAAPLTEATPGPTIIITS
jgi:hypothetical protein